MCAHTHMYWYTYTTITRTAHALTEAWCVHSHLPVLSHSLTELTMLRFMASFFHEGMTGLDSGCPGMKEAYLG